MPNNRGLHEDTALVFNNAAFNLPFLLLLFNQWGFQDLFLNLFFQEVLLKKVKAGVWKGATEDRISRNVSVYFLPRKRDKQVLRLFVAPHSGGVKYWRSRRCCRLFWGGKLWSLIFTGRLRGWQIFFAQIELSYQFAFSGVVRNNALDNYVRGLRNTSHT